MEKEKDLINLIKEREMQLYLKLASENKITSSIVAEDELWVYFENPSLTINANSGPIEYKEDKLFNLGKRYIFEDANVDINISKIKNKAILDNYSDVKFHLFSSYYIDDSLVGSLTHSSNYCYKLKDLKNPFI